MSVSEYYIWLVSVSEYKLVYNIWPFEVVDCKRINFAKWWMIIMFYKTKMRLTITKGDTAH